MSEENQLKPEYQDVADKLIATVADYNYAKLNQTISYIGVNKEGKSVVMGCITNDPILIKLLEFHISNCELVAEDLVVCEKKDIGNAS